MRHRGKLAGSIILSVGLVGAAVSAPALASAGKHKHKGTVIATVTTNLGRVVSSPKGHVMWRFMKDGHNSSACGASCHAFWPPVMSKAKARAGAHISKAHLGRTSAGQVTYYGHPLYFFVEDPKPGKTTHDGIKDFGDHWYVVSTTGKPVKPKQKPTRHSGGPKAPTGPADVTTGMVGAATVLTSTNGHTLYELSSESGSPASFTCTGSCPTMWPPLLTKGAPTASGDAQADLLGTVTRMIASKRYTQVTYNNHPLYNYSGDTGAGQSGGEGLYDPPGYWYELTAAGMAH